MFADRKGGRVNEYLRNLRRMEFAVTTACTGKCKHCQNGEQTGPAEHIDAEAAVKAIRRVCGSYSIGKLMTFGGEPLLYPDTVCAIHSAAREMGIGKRQLITNGFFSQDPGKIEEVARSLARSGVNDLLLSVDAFHQETIPLGPVRLFAECAVKAGIPVRLSPAWLVSREDANPYNDRTRELLREFEPMGIPVDEGNVIFPMGNALKYLREYFGENAAEWSPYEEDPADIRSLSFSADGGVLNGNIYETDILEIMESYRPETEGIELKVLTAENEMEIIEFNKLCFPTDFWKESDWHELLTDPRAVYYALLDGERIVGDVFIYNWQGELDYVKIMNLGIHPDYRRRGFAHRLLGHVSAEMAKLGMKRFCAETRESNLAMQKVFDDCGYKLNRIEADCFENPPESAYKYVLQL